MIQEPFRDDVIRTPLKWTAPRCQVRRRGIPLRSRGVRASVVPGGGHPLADHDGPWPGPGVKPRRIGGLAAVVGSQHQVDRRVGLRFGGQLDEAELIEVAGEQKMTASVLDVEHQAAGVVGGFRVPALRADGARGNSYSGLAPRRRRGDRPHWDAMGPHLVEQQLGAGFCSLAKPGGMTISPIVNRSSRSGRAL